MLLARSCSQADDNVTISHLAEFGRECVWVFEHELVTLIDDPDDFLISCSMDASGIELVSRLNVHRFAEDVVQICEESVVSLPQQIGAKIEANDARFVLEVEEHRKNECHSRFSVT